MIIDRNISKGAQINIATDNGTIYATQNITINIEDYIQTLQKN